MSEPRVLLSHGDGGQRMADLIERVFLAHFGPSDPPGDDAAQLPAPTTRLAFTTDSFVVDPIFFPGGDIGKLAVCGTLNDLATAGARQAAISAAFILEEGLLLSDLDRIVASMAAAAAEAGVRVVTGDTKVVPRGNADRIFITTSGVGTIPEGLFLSGANARPGDAVLLSGAVGDHGMAVLSCREGLEFASPIVSDCAPLGEMVEHLLHSVPSPRALRDPTRGGLATALNEIARQSNVTIEVDEWTVPVHDEVAAAADLLGLDPLYLANEGKMVAIVPPEQAETALAALREHRYGREAAIIGRVMEGAPRVLLHTALDSHRLLDRHVGEPMPRIC